MPHRYNIVFVSIMLFFAFLPSVSAQDGDTKNNSEAPCGCESGLARSGLGPSGGDPRTLPVGKISIIIHGNVAMEDGSRPPEGTVIVNDCGPNVTREIVVNPDGSFSFRYKDENKGNGLYADAATNPNFSVPLGDTWMLLNPLRFHGKPEHDSELSSCVLEAKYDGYQSNGAHLVFEDGRGEIDVGTLILHPVSAIKDNTVSVANLKAPKKAKSALEKGKKEFEQNEFSQAEKHYRSALARYPEYPQAWIELGWLFQKEMRYDEARKAYRSALNADKSYVDPYVRLAQLEALDQKWEKSIEYSSEALSLAPASSPEAYFLNGLAYYNLDRLEEAENSIRKGIQTDRAHKIPKIHLVLANILARKNDPSGAVESMRTYLEFAPNAPDAGAVRSLINKNEKAIRNIGENNPRAAR